MGRPLWMDFFYLGGFFLPPVVTAAILAGKVAKHLHLSGPVGLLGYFVAVVICSALWVAGFVAWSRHTGAMRGKKGDPE